MLPEEAAADVVQLQLRCLENCWKADSVPMQQHALHQVIHMGKHVICNTTKEKGPGN